MCTFTYSHMLAVWVGIYIMWINVERYQVQSIEGWGIHDWHIIGCIDAQGGNIRSCAGPNIWHPIINNLLVYCFNELLVVECFEQPERISTS